MMETGKQQKPSVDLPGDPTVDSNFSARDPLEQNSQLYSTVTDFARLRG